MSAIHALHVRSLPPPNTYAKSRAILNALQRFGLVNAFISLRYFPSSKSPNTSLVVFKTRESLQRALKSSPLRVVPLGSDGGREDEIVCDLSISRMDHFKNARNNQYSGPFLVDRQSMPYHALKASGVPLDEYADCAVNDKTRLLPAMRQQYLDDAVMPHGSLMDMWRRAGETKGDSSNQLVNNELDNK